MPEINPFPLNISFKVNSPDLLAWFAAFGESGYLSAEEINKIDLALKFLYENMGGGALNGSGITTLGTISIDADEVTFSDFAWRYQGNDYAQEDPIVRILPFASPGMYRTHTAYFTTTNDIDIAVGEESDEVTTEPDIPEGTLRMRAFNVFGDVITVGPGEALPYDINLLDELLQAPQDNDYLLINHSGIDFKIKWLWLNLMEFLKLKILTADPTVPAADRVNLYTLANTLAAQFPDGQTIKFLKNASQNGILQMPYYSGLVEIQRPMKNIAGPSSYTILPDDASRTLLVGSTNNLDIVIPFPPTSGGNHIIEIVNNSTGIIRLTTTTYKVNGSLDPIILETNTLYRLKRVSALDYILTPKPGGGTVPSATDLIAGIMKMYTSYGAGVDGTIRQDFFTTEMAKKANLNRVEQFIISKPVGVHGTVSNTPAETVLLQIPFQGGDFEYGDYIGFNIWTTKIGTDGVTGLFLRAGTAGTTADPVLTILQQHIGGQSSASSGRVGIILEEGNFIHGRTRPIVNAVSQDFGSFVTAAKLNLNPANPWFLTVTATHVVSTDTINVSTYQVTKTKSFL